MSYENMERWQLPIIETIATTADPEVAAHLSIIAPDPSVVDVLLTRTANLALGSGVFGKRAAQLSISSTIGF